MFTGLIEEVGTVLTVRHSAGESRLAVHAPRVGPGTAVGDSICVNGVCLTVVAGTAGRLEFEAVAETLRRSNLGELRPGDRVNLERAMGAGGRFGGHIMQGHVDAIGRVARIVPEANSHVITVEAPPEVMRYVVEKGSVALDGISLTVAAVTGPAFTVAIIPHTWAVTTLGGRKPGDRLNLEVDILAKYVERLLEARLGPSAPAAKHTGLTEAALRESGFA
jgi:riboflavin synthase